MISLPENPSGAECVAAIDRAAAARGVTTLNLVRHLSTQPNGWLRQIGGARRPSAETLERIRALLAGEAIPPRPRHGPPVLHLAPRAPPVTRDPCFFCGTRADLGCRHHPIEARG